MNPTRSDFLFADTSLVIGAGSVLCLAGNYFEFNESQTGDEADAKGLYSDFAMVGKDLLSARDILSQGDDD